MIPGKRFDPATETSRRPTPAKFVHLRKWIEAKEQFIDLTSITEITNINQQLEQTAKLFVSNIISRVIAQIIGKYGDGFVTIEGTVDGRLKVESVVEAKVVEFAKIDFAAAGDNTVVAGTAGKQIKLVTIVLTVSGETNLIFKAGATAISGAMDFGGDGEPRGMVPHHGCCALELTAGQAFVINSSNAVQVSGYVTGFIE